MPNFLQVENPARFLRGPNATLTRALTWNYLIYVNLALLVAPVTLRADYSHRTIPLVEDPWDPRNAQTAVAAVVAAYAGRTWVRNTDWLTREGFYGAMIRDNPGNPKAHYGYGNVVVNDIKREDVGVRHLLEASRLQPNYFDAYNDLGAFYNRKGDYAAATAQFEFAAAAKPEHINGLHNMGLNYLAARDYERAFYAFDRAVEFFPDSVDFYNYMGQALQGLHMEEDALAAYGSVVELQPLSARSYYLYGLAAGQMGRAELAESTLRVAVRLVPNFVEAVYNLGVSLAQQQRLEEAFGYFLRVQAYRPDYPGLKHYIDMLRPIV